MSRTPRLAFAVLALLGASSAFAGGEFDPLTGFGPASVAAPCAPASRPATAGLTRDQVKAELAAARAQGTSADFDVGMNYAQAPRAASGLTREQVREETRLALRASRAGSGS